MQDERSSLRIPMQWRALSRYGICFAARAYCGTRQGPQASLLYGPPFVSRPSLQARFGGSNPPLDEAGGTRGLFDTRR